MATYSDWKPSKHDDYFTRESTWKQIAPYIPQGKVISMPFYSPYSKCNELLSKFVDNEIIYMDEDFFKNDRGDIVVDNVPFSKKKEIIKELVKRDKPFMIIVPISTICYNYSRILKEHVQLLIFEKRQSYIRCDIKTGELKDSSRHPAFDSVVICWKMNLPNDINYLSK
jgi:hypothetical protein